MSGPLAREVVRRVRAQVENWPAHPPVAALDRLLRLVGKWRSQALALTQIQHHGPRIWGGLFEGMEYDDATEGSLLTRLLGTYEASLQPHLLEFVAEGLDCVIDIGCAEGYYAVGLARRFPHLVVHAHDIDEGAQKACAGLAAKNGVADRVHIGGEFTPEGFEAFRGRRVLVMVDAEGAEIDILRPDLSPALAHMKLIVETHDVWRPGALATLAERFAPTHRVDRVDQDHHTRSLPPWLAECSEMDQLLATWEWRKRATPWLVMRPLAKGPSA